MSKTNLTPFLLLGGAAVACMAAVANLGTPEPHTAVSHGAAPPSPENAKQKLERERFAAATKGIEIKNGTVAVRQTPMSDRKLAVKLTDKAERVLETENSWFLAVGAFRDAIVADPTFARAYEGMARGFLLDGDVDNARPALNKALELDPRFDRARYARAQMIEAEGNYAKAVSEYRLIDRGYEDVVARMAVASYFAGDNQQAWEFVDEAKQRGQRVPDQLVTLLKEVAPRP